MLMISDSAYFVYQFFIYMGLYKPTPKIKSILLKCAKLEFLLKLPIPPKILVIFFLDPFLYFTL
jgi:hypothetical protein